MRRPDAVVVGSGPNGLMAALTLARRGLGVEIFEAADKPGGGCRTAELTLPGFRHDVCSSVHPLLLASPAFRDVDLVGRNVRLLTPSSAFAHPLDGGRAVTVSHSIEETAEALGSDAAAYTRAFGPLVRDLGDLLPAVLGTMRSVPHHPLAAARFGLRGLPSAAHLARAFRTEEGRALVAGTAAHSMRPLTAPLTSAFAHLFTALAHGFGWPVVEGGSQAIVDALVEELTSLGARIETGHLVRDLGELPVAPAVLLDVTPRQLVELAGGRLGVRARRALQRYRYGPGVCKVDWALRGPVPWSAPQCHQAVTLHLGGSFAEIARSEAEVNAGRHPEQPFCLVTQPCVIDPSRAPAGRQTLWAYCHVPNGSDVDMTDRIEAQIERFAPGFRDQIEFRSSFTAVATEKHNPTYVGGDINAGAATVRQTLFRPTPRANPYRTALDGVYLCSAATPPGGGVHGMCGLGAARTALRDLGAQPAAAVRH